MSVYKLRPHHGICIAFFEGKGYSPEFVANMTAVIRSLEKSSYIKLFTGEDIICSCCPNSKDQKCINKVKQYDKAVLDACDLHPDQVLSWGKFTALIYEKIILKDKLYSVCGSCEWSGICQKKADRIIKKRELP